MKSDYKLINSFLLDDYFICHEKAVNPKAAKRCFAGLTAFTWQIPYKQAGMNYSALLAP